MGEYVKGFNLTDYIVYYTSINHNILFINLLIVHISFHETQGIINHPPTQTIDLLMEPGVFFTL